MDPITALRERRARVLSDAERVARAAAGENRHLTDDEQRVYENALADVDAIDARIGELVEQQHRSQRANDAFRQAAGGRLALPTVADREIVDRFRDMVLRNDRAPLEVRDEAPRSGWQPGIERRALATTTGGGLRPTSFYDQIVESLVEGNALLAAGATLITSDSGETLRIPRDTGKSTAGIVAEGAQIPASDPTVGTVGLTPYKYATIVYASTELVTDASFDAAGYVARETGVALGVAAGADFIAGNGTNKPTGLLTSAVVGKTSTTAASFGADDLIDLSASVASPYARSRSSAWLMSNAALATVRKMKASTAGTYLFSTDVEPGSGAAGTLLGRPVYVDGSMPAPASNALAVAFGDFSRVFVRQVNGVRFDRSDEFKFDTDTVSFRAIWRADAALVDPVAIKVLKCGA